MTTDPETKWRLGVTKKLKTFFLKAYYLGGLLLCVLSAYAGGSIIVGGTGPTHIIGTAVGNVRGTLIPAPVTTNTYCDGRFEVWSDNTNVVVDNDSGLTWLRNATIGGQMDWTNAVDFCDNLETNGYSDWRLPSLTELSRDDGEGAADGFFDDWPSTNDPALPLGHPFVSIRPNYWTSTPKAFNPESAWVVEVADGELYDFVKIYVGQVYPWPCRGP